MEEVKSGDRGCHPVKSQPRGFNIFSFTLHDTFNINRIRAFFSVELYLGQKPSYTQVSGDLHTVLLLQRY